MIHCDHPGCIAPIGYRGHDVVMDATQRLGGYEAVKRVLPIRPEKGGPEWAQFVIDGRCYCGFCADEHDPDQTKRTHVLAITDAAEWQAHEQRQRGAKRG